MNAAHKVAREFGDDGLCFERNSDGVTMLEACLRRHGELTRMDAEEWRFDFNDGSAIVGNANGWDIAEQSHGHGLPQPEIHDEQSH